MRNPVVGFANFRDSLKHLVKSSLAWNKREEIHYLHYNMT